MASREGRQPARVVQDEVGSGITAKAARVVQDEVGCGITARAARVVQDEVGCGITGSTVCTASELVPRSPHAKSRSIPTRHSTR